MFLSSNPRLDHVDGATNNYNQLEIPAVSHNLRALIHAYGSDNRSRPSWQTTEEEEFDWEDISSAPTSGADRGQRDGFLQSPESSSKRLKRPRHTPDDSSIVSKGANSIARVSPGNMNDKKNHNLFSPRPQQRQHYTPHPLLQPSQRGMNCCLNSRTVSFHSESGVNAVARSVVVPASIGLRPPQQQVHSLQPPPPLNPIMPMQNQKVQHNNFINSSNIVNQPNRMQPPRIPPTQAAPVLPHPVIPNNTALQAILPANNANTAVSSKQPASAFSGLLNSLMAQGLISLTNANPAQDSIGLEFDADLLKVRHESAIKALYGDLPRQCATCGRRFKSQEEHHSHMDWHVTKNRMSKNPKAERQSRKWFVSASLWLGFETSAVPVVFSTETTVENKSREGMAVPADEDTKICALCGDRFEEFYSDEAEEWMFRDATYLNAANGSTAGMDSSQLGPAVHVKCRSD